MESFHPIVVHFPIALLVTALFWEGVGLVTGKSSFYRLSFWTLCLGTLAAAVAVWTGLQAEAVAKHNYEIFQVMQLHKKLGIATLSLATGASLYRLFFRDQLSRRARLALFLLLLAAAGTLGLGSHLGGRLVFEFGVGGTYGREGGIQVVRAIVNI